MADLLRQQEGLQKISVEIRDFEHALHSAVSKGTFDSGRISSDLVGLRSTVLSLRVDSPETSDVLSTIERKVDHALGQIRELERVFEKNNLSQEEFFTANEEWKRYFRRK